MRERRQGADHRQLTHVALAEIGLEPPDRDQDLPRHAVFLLDARQQRGVTLQHRACAIDANRTDAGCDILLEGLVEGVALAAVEGEHAPIRGDAGKRLRDDGLRNAGGLRIGRDVRNEGVEVAAAAGGEHWSGERERTEQDREAKAIHLWWVLADGSQFGEANSMSAGGTWKRVLVATRST